MSQSKRVCPPVRQWNRGELPIRRLRLTTSQPNRALRTLDVSAAMRQVCNDIVARCPELAHVDVERILISIVPARSSSPYGLQSRLTPLRFDQGATQQRRGRTLYRVQRYEVAGVEMLYLLSFCVPRFFQLPFAEKLLTIFHELYHVHPSCNGALRRLPGACSLHGPSKRAYDAHMAELVREYLAKRPAETLLGFLRRDVRSLSERYDSIQGVVVPRPLIYPIEE